MSKKVLQELEQWASQKEYYYAVLETDIYFATARRLYETNGYSIIPNYLSYRGLTGSVCMKKELVICNR